MNKAIDNYHLGKQVEVEAPQGVSVSASSKRYQCPCCLEYVALDVRGWFRHKNITPESIECENRVSGHSESLYERLGVPLYLMEVISGNYELYLSFPPLTEAVNHLAQDSLIIVCGSKDQKETYLIRGRFSTKHNSFIKMNYSYSNTGYTFKYSDNVAQEIRKRFSSNSDKVGNGAFFKLADGMSKKIRYGGTIALDTEYLFIGDKHALKNKKIRCDKCGMLSFADKSLPVYKLIIPSMNLSDSEFLQISRFFSINYKINLVSKDSQLMSIWPPSITNGSTIFFDNEDPFADLYIDSNNENPKVFQFYQQSYEEKHLTISQKCIRITLSDNPKYFSVDKSYNGNIQVIKRACISPITKQYEYDITDEKGNSVINTKDANYIPRRLHVKTNFSGVIVRKSKRNESVIITNNSLSGIALDEIKRGDIIELYSRNWNLVYRHVFNKEKKRTNSLDEQVFADKLKLLDGRVIPIDMKAITLFRSVNRTSLLYPYIKKYVSRREYPLGAVEIVASYLRRDNNE